MLRLLSVLLLILVVLESKHPSFLKPRNLDAGKDSSRMHDDTVKMKTLDINTISLNDDDSSSESDSTTTSLYPNSCYGLEDGYHYLKLLEDTDDISYPVVKQMCSNGYILLNYFVDNNIKYYFKSWYQWHINAWGPTNTDIVNWEGWFLPHNDNTYLVSPECDSCDITNPNNLYDTKTTYYFTGTIFGCFFVNKGQHNCDMDYDTLQCYFCTSQFASDETVLPIPDPPQISSYFSSGVCAFNIRESDNLDLPTSHYDCTENSQYKPSIGGKGQRCVCTQNTDVQYYEGIITETSFQSSKSDIIERANLHNEEFNIEDIEDSLTVYELYQSDFEKGTYRITSSGKYLIMEDIEFDFKPNDDSPQADDAWWPTEDDDQDYYPGAGGYRKPYFMGFWAGITIEAANVILDLQGHTLKQSLKFYYQQRWFVTVALEKQYFLPGQGLGQFGAEPRYAKNTIVRNGILGLTSHHGIHGNSNTNLILENLEISNFETHGIQLNGYKNIILRDLDIGQTSNIVHFRGEYAHMRALLRRFRTVATQTSGETIQFYGRDSAVTMQDIVDEIELKMNMAWNYVVYDEEYDDDDEDWIDAKKLFINEHGYPNGGAQYGLFLNTHGASVFTYNLYTREQSKNALLQRIKVHDMAHKMDEIVTTRKAYDPGLYINPITAPFNIADLFEDYKNPLYKGTILTDAYFALEYFSNDWNLLAAQVAGKNHLVKWAQDGDQSAIGTNDNGEMQIGCNFDVMIHSGKGINGLRLDGVDGVTIQDVEIYNLRDYTPEGSEMCGSYSEIKQDSLMSGEAMPHFRQTVPMQDGFSGNIVQGFEITSAKNVILKNINVHDLYSDTGNVFGIAAWPSNDIELQGDIIVDNLNAGIELEMGTYSVDDRPNSAPLACGILVYSFYSSTEYNGDYYTYVTKSDNANIYSTNINGHSGCIGMDDIPTMIGYGTSLNEQTIDDDSSDINYTNYDDMATYLLDQVNNSDDDDDSEIEHKYGKIFLAIFASAFLLSCFYIIKVSICNKGDKLNNSKMYIKLTPDEHDIYSYGSI